jgi:hypothetical protein
VLALWEYIYFFTKSLEFFFIKNYLFSCGIYPCLQMEVLIHSMLINEVNNMKSLVLLSITTSYRKNIM